VLYCRDAVSRLGADSVMLLEHFAFYSEVSDAAAASNAAASGKKKKE
jgi:hypothetical protein